MVLYVRINNRKEYHHGHQYHDGLNTLNEKKVEKVGTANKVKENVNDLKRKLLDSSEGKKDESKVPLKSGEKKETAKAVPKKETGKAAPKKETGKAAPKKEGVKATQKNETKKGSLKKVAPDEAKKEATEKTKTKSEKEVDEKPRISIGKKVRDGFYFTRIENVARQYKKGCWLRIVDIPKDDKDLKCVEIGDGIYKANKIILGKRHYLYDPETIKRFNLPYNDDFMDILSGLGETKMLNQWVKSGLKLCYSYKAIDTASEKGHIETLKWWFNSGLYLKFSSLAIDYASMYNQVKSLDFWLDLLKKDIIEPDYFVYSNSAINWASENNSIRSLQWWSDHMEELKKYGLELKYSCSAMDGASCEGHIDVLNFFLRNFRFKKDLELKYTRYGYEIAKKKNMNHIVKFWTESGLIKE